jgi:hypothetical protein
MRMFQPGEDLALVPETAPRDGGIDLPFDDLDGHPLLEIPVVADCFENRSLAALAETPYQTVGANTLFAHVAPIGAGGHRSHHSRNGCAAFGVPQQRSYLAPHVFVFNRRDSGCALLGSEFVERIEESFHADPLVAGHGFHSVTKL